MEMEDESMEVEVAPEDDPAKLAKRSVKKILMSVRDGGPRMLREELASDFRKQLREELLIEFKYDDELFEFADVVDKADIASIAFDLFHNLAMLDVHSSFDLEKEDGSKDMESLQTEVLTGEVCTISGVIKRFREILFEIMSSYQHSALSNEAAYILSAGERIWEIFSSNYLQVVEWEAKMLRVFTICDKGLSIGFKKGCGRRRTNAVDRLSVSEKGSLNLSGTEPVVTYMNYRDEKGHSVMGMSMDSQECERRVGQIFECHGCCKIVRDASGELFK